MVVCFVPDCGNVVFPETTVVPQKFSSWAFSTSIHWSRMADWNPSNTDTFNQAGQSYLIKIGVHISLED
ncbi:hypothetical protein Chor_014487 [Crotalus horridus]